MDFGSNWGHFQAFGAHLGAFSGISGLSGGIFRHFGPIWGTFRGFSGLFGLM